MSGRALHSSRTGERWTRNLRQECPASGVPSPRSADSTNQGEQKSQNWRPMGRTRAVDHRRAPWKSDITKLETPTINSPSRPLRDKHKGHLPTATKFNFLWSVKTKGTGVTPAPRSLCYQEHPCRPLLWKREVWWRQLSDYRVHLQGCQWLQAVPLQDCTHDSTS